MRIETVAVILREGGRFVSEWMLTRTRKAVQVEYPKIKVFEEEEENTPKYLVVEPVASKENKATEDKIKKGTSCIPCTNSHLHACVGLLNEAVRFAKTDGLSADALKRIDTCLGEIVAAERIDLNPENTAGLAPGEKAIADYAAVGLRNIRHDLEGLTKPDQVEPIAAKTAELQHSVAQKWFQYRLSNMSDEDKAKLGQKVIDKFQELPK